MGQKMYDNNGFVTYILLAFILGMLLFQPDFSILLQRDSDEDTTPITNFNELRVAVDSMEDIQSYIDIQSDILEEKSARIEVLENTDWVVKYELVKSELEQERDNQPSAIIVIYISGFMAFAIVFVFTWLYRKKEHDNLISENKTLKKKMENKNE